MYRTILCALRSSIWERFRTVRNRFRLGIGALVFLIGVGAVMAPVHGGALSCIACPVVFRATVAIYVYDAQGTPILTPDATILDGGVYTDSGFLGTIDVDNTIVNNDDIIVGYVGYSGPVGP